MSTSDRERVAFSCFDNQEIPYGRHHFFLHIFTIELFHSGNRGGRYLRTPDLPVAIHAQRLETNTKKAISTSVEARDIYSTLARSHAQILQARSEYLGQDGIAAYKALVPHGYATKSAFSRLEGPYGLAFGIPTDQAKLSDSVAPMMKTWEVRVGDDISGAAALLSAAAKIKTPGVFYHQMTFNGVILRAGPETAPDKIVTHYRNALRRNDALEKPTERLRRELNERREEAARIAEAQAECARLIDGVVEKTKAAIANGRGFALSNAELADLIRSVAGLIEKVNDSEEAATMVDPLIVAGITGPRHRGEGELMNVDDEFGVRMRLEWFAGELVNMIMTGQTLGMNSWLNTVDKFTAIPKHYAKRAPNESGLWSGLMSFGKKFFG